MKNKIGMFCMILGTMLVLTALSLFVYNQYENKQAEKSVKKLLPLIMEQIEISTTDTSERDRLIQNFLAPTMSEVKIEGQAYIGYLSIPSIALEIPVMSEWDYNRLKTAPCRYAGSTKTDDLVIAAHNYSRHFGSIRELGSGDVIYFTDMNGMVWQYEVEITDILAPADVEDMLDGDYALTLFTCNYSGTSRITVRCRRVIK